MPTVELEVMTLDEARERYESIVETIPDLEDFRDKGRTYALDRKDRSVYEDLLELEFLIGE